MLHLVRFGITNIPKDASAVRYNDLSTSKIVGDTVGDRVGLAVVYQQVRSWFMIPTESHYEEAHTRGGVGFLLVTALTGPFWIADVIRLFTA